MDQFFLLAVIRKWKFIKFFSVKSWRSNIKFLCIQLYTNGYKTILWSIFNSSLF